MNSPQERINELRMSRERIEAALDWLSWAATAAAIVAGVLLVLWIGGELIAAPLNCGMC
jgi:hypothetical protein